MSASWLAGLVLVSATGEASAAGGGPVVVAPAPAVPSAGVAEGLVPGQTRLRLTVVLRSSQPAGLAAFARAVSTAGSPEFRHFLTVRSFAARFGASPAAVAAVTSALRARGLSPGPLAADRLSFRLSAPVSRIDQAFGTRLRWYRLPGGRQEFANVRPAFLPRVAAAQVQTVLGLNDLVTASPASVAQPERAPRVSRASAERSPAEGAPQPCSAASGVPSAYTANQLAEAYGFDALYDQGAEGAGERMALVEFETYKQDDVSAYQACYGTSVPLTTVPVDGGAPTDKTDQEAASDIEVAVGMAPALRGIDVYEAPPTDSYDEFSQIVSDDRDKVISDSWYVCEPAQQADPGELSAEETVLEEAAVQGQSFFAATGDVGSANCYTPKNKDGSLAVADPASQPYVTGVGGTSLFIAQPDQETVWNDAAGAGGGGISAAWPIPSWQGGPGVVNGYSSGTPCGSASTICREVPDVSASADPARGYAVYYDGKWQDLGGTSLATPLWASLTAIGNESCEGVLGFLDPALYAIASTPGSGAFNDIIDGNNDWLGDNNGDYPATAG